MYFTDSDRKSDCMYFTDSDRKSDCMYFTDSDRKSDYMYFTDSDGKSEYILFTHLLIMMQIYMIMMFNCSYGDDENVRQKLFKQ